MKVATGSAVSVSSSVSNLIQTGILMTTLLQVETSKFELIPLL